MCGEDQGSSWLGEALHRLAELLRKTQEGGRAIRLLKRAAIGADYPTTIRVVGVGGNGGVGESDLQGSVQGSSGALAPAWTRIA